MQINEQDEWLLYKRAKCFMATAERLSSEASAEHEKAKRHHDALASLPDVGADALGSLAARTADRAYQQATKDLVVVSQLVEEVKQKCRDACAHLR